MKKILILFVVVCSWFYIFCGSTLGSYDIYWNGSSGGSWRDPSNWSPVSLPHANSIVHLDNGVVCIDDADETATILQFIISGESLLLIQSNRRPCLSMNTFNNYAKFNINGWENQGIDITGSLNNFEGAELSFFSSLRIICPSINNSGSMEIEANVQTNCDDSNFTNSGSLEIDNSSFIGVKNFYNNGTIECGDGELGAEGEMINSSLIYGYGYVGAETSFKNEAGATITASYGTLVLEGGSLFSNFGIIKNLPMSSVNIILPETSICTNFGNIIVNTGGGVNVHGDLFNNSSATILMLGGSLAASNINQAQGASFSGFGNITGNITINTDGIIQLTGPTNIVGDVTVASNATLEIKDGQTLITGHTTNNGTIHVIGGIVIFQGGLTNNGNIIRESGQYSDSADLDRSGTVDGSDLAIFGAAFGWNAGL